MTCSFQGSEKPGGEVRVRKDVLTPEGTSFQIFFDKPEETSVVSRNITTILGFYTIPIARIIEDSSQPSTIEREATNSHVLMNNPESH